MNWYWERHEIKSWKIYLFYFLIILIFVINFFYIFFIVIPYINDVSELPLVPNKVNLYTLPNNGLVNKDYYYIIDNNNKLSDLKLNPENRRWMYTWYNQYSNQFLYVNHKYKNAFVFDLFFNDKYKNIKKDDKLDYLKELYLKEGKIDEYWEFKDNNKWWDGCWWDIWKDWDNLSDEKKIEEKILKYSKLNNFFLFFNDFKESWVLFLTKIWQNIPPNEESVELNILLNSFNLKINRSLFDLETENFENIITVTRWLNSPGQSYSNNSCNYFYFEKSFAEIDFFYEKEKGLLRKIEEEIKPFLENENSNIKLNITEITFNGKLDKLICDYKLNKYLNIIIKNFHDLIGTYNKRIDYFSNFNFNDWKNYYNIRLEQLNKKKSVWKEHSSWLLKNYKINLVSFNENLFDELVSINSINTTEGFLNLETNLDTDEGVIEKHLKFKRFRNKILNALVGNFSNNLCDSHTRNFVQSLIEKGNLYNYTLMEFDKKKMELLLKMTFELNVNLRAFKMYKLKDNNYFIILKDLYSELPSENNNTNSTVVNKDEAKQIKEMRELGVDTSKDLKVFCRNQKKNIAWICNCLDEYHRIMLQKEFVSNKNNKDVHDAGKNVLEILKGKNIQISNVEQSWNSILGWKEINNGEDRFKINNCNNNNTRENYSIIINSNNCLLNKEVSLRVKYNFVDVLNNALYEINFINFKNKYRKNENCSNLNCVDNYSSKLYKSIRQEIADYNKHQYKKNLNTKNKMEDDIWRIKREIVERRILKLWRELSEYSKKANFFSIFLNESSEKIKEEFNIFNQLRLKQNKIYVRDTVPCTKWDLFKIELNKQYNFNLPLSISKVDKLENKRLELNKLLIEENKKEWNKIESLKKELKDNNSINNKFYEDLIYSYNIERKKLLKKTLLLNKFIQEFYSRRDRIEVVETILLNWAKDLLDSAKNAKIQRKNNYIMKELDSFIKNKESKVNYYDDNIRNSMRDSKYDLIFVLTNMQEIKPLSLPVYYPGTKELIPGEKHPTLNQIKAYNSLREKYYNSESLHKYFNKKGHYVWYNDDLEKKYTLEGWLLLKDMAGAFTKLNELYWIDWNKSIISDQKADEERYFNRFFDRVELFYKLNIKAHKIGDIEEIERLKGKKPEWKSLLAKRLNETMFGPKEYHSLHESTNFISFHNYPNVWTFFNHFFTENFYLKFINNRYVKEITTHYDIDKGLLNFFIGLNNFIINENRLKTDILKHSEIFNNSNPEDVQIINTFYTYNAIEKKFTELKNYGDKIICDSYGEKYALVKCNEKDFSKIPEQLKKICILPIYTKVNGIFYRIVNDEQKYVHYNLLLEAGVFFLKDYSNFSNKLWFLKLDLNQNNLNFLYKERKFCNIYDYVLYIIKAINNLQNNEINKYHKMRSELDHLFIKHCIDTKKKIKLLNRHQDLYNSLIPYRDLNFAEREWIINNNISKLETNLYIKHRNREFENTNKFIDVKNVDKEYINKIILQSNCKMDNWSQSPLAKFIKKKDQDGLIFAKKKYDDHVIIKFFNNQLLPDFVIKFIKESSLRFEPYIINQNDILFNTNNFSKFLYTDREKIFYEFEKKRISEINEVDYVINYLLEKFIIYKLNTQLENYYEPSLSLALLDFKLNNNELKRPPFLYVFSDFLEEWEAKLPLKIINFYTKN